MKTETITGDSLEDVEAKRALWLSSHPTAVVIKTYGPAIVRRPAGVFAPIEERKIRSVTISFGYEDEA